MEQLQSIDNSWEVYQEGVWQALNCDNQLQMLAKDARELTDLSEDQITELLRRVKLFAQIMVHHNLFKERTPSMNTTDDNCSSELSPTNIDHDPQRILWNENNLYFEQFGSLGNKLGYKYAGIIAYKIFNEYGATVRAEQALAFSTKYDYSMGTDVFNAGDFEQRPYQVRTLQETITQALQANSALTTELAARTSENQELLNRVQILESQIAELRSLLTHTAGILSPSSRVFPLKPKTSQAAVNKAIKTLTHQA